MKPAKLLMIALLVAPPAFGQKPGKPQIPVEFHGIWAISREDCRIGGDQMLIRKNHIVGIGGESGWTLKHIEKKDRQAFTGRYDFGGEGLEEFNISITLRRLPNRQLRFDNTYWVYCRRHF
jgi:hypothetical protein